MSTTTSSARMTFDGLEVCITRSAGSDGALVVFIDGPRHDADSNADGSPAIRVMLNDADLYSGRAYAPADDAAASSKETGIRPMTMTVEITEPEPGVYLARATSDDGDQVAVESGDSPYEAACDALATITPSIDPTAGA
jgi:hypothetical protein